MWIQFLRHKRIVAKGDKRKRADEAGKAFEENPFAQIGWPPLASAIGVSLAIKKFCTAQKKKEKEKSRKTKNARLVRGVNVAQFRGIFSLAVRNTKRPSVKKYSRSIVAEDRKFDRSAFRERKTYGPSKSIKKSEHRRLANVRLVARWSFVLSTVCTFFFFFFFRKKLMPNLKHCRSLLYTTIGPNVPYFYRLVNSRACNFMTCTEFLLVIA